MKIPTFCLQTFSIAVTNYKKRFWKVFVQWLKPQYKNNCNYSNNIIFWIVFTTETSQLNEYQGTFFAIYGNGFMFTATFWQWFSNIRWIFWHHFMIFPSTDFRDVLCQFSGSGQGTLSNFLEILFKLSLPHMTNICNIWMKSVKKWHDYKAFWLGGSSREGSNCSY